MKNTYKHLSSKERDKIAILRAQGLSYYDISIAIGRDKSTISREINRNKAPIYKPMKGLKNENIKLALEIDSKIL